MAKLTEKRLYLVPPQAFTANGDASGKVTIVDTRKFVVGHIVIIKSSTQPHLTLKVKRIISRTEMFVGPEKEPIQTRIDLTAYLVADTASVQAAEQNRPTIPEQDIERNTYAEEPTVARRVTMVDPMGDPYDNDNPIPVTVDTTVNIGDVRITACDNDPNPGNVHSSVRISDCINDLAINPDGSINVIVPPGAGGIPVNEFNQIASVVASTLTTIMTYTVPLTYSAILFRIEVGGSNVATYEVYINSILEARKRTWFSGPITDVIEFSSGVSGFQLFASDVVEIKVTHNRPFVGDFEARLQAMLQ